MKVTRSNSSLRPLILFTVLFFFVWTLRATYFYRIDDAMASDSARLIYANVVKFLLWMVPAFGFSFWVRRASPYKYLGFTTKPSARKWLTSFVILGTYMGIVIGFEMLANGKHFSLDAFPPLTFSWFLSAFISPLIEEILFRGLLLKEFATHLAGWQANLLASLLFAGIHLPFWLSHNGLNMGVLANTLGVFLFSLIAGSLYLRTSSLWPPYVAHVINNLIAGVLVT